MKKFIIRTTILTLLFQSMLFNNTTFAEGASFEQKENMKQKAELLILIKKANNIIPGTVSISYEVPYADGGYISSGKGDAGGKSYGVSQFTSKGHASANSFIEWLYTEDIEFGSFFLNADKAGTESFDKAWKDAFEFNSDKFTKYQKQYTMDFYVNPFIYECKAELGVDFNSTLALQESAYSLAVQFGKNGALTIVRNSGINASSTEEEVIKLLYSEKRNSIGTYKFLACSKEVQKSVYNRFINEEQDILDIYKNNPCNSLVNLNLETF